MHDGEIALLEVTASNKSANAIKIFPKLSIYNRTTDGAVLYASSTLSATVLGKQDKTIQQYLPDLQLGPGVYALSLGFYDAAGNELARPVEGRYVIAGDIATIQNVSVDKQIFKDGEYAMVRVVYSGTPIDINSPTARTGQKAQLTVRLFNQNDEAVSVGTQEVPLDASETVVPLSMQIDKGSHALRAEVEIEKDGKILASLKTNLSDTYESQRGVKESNPSTILYVIGLAVLILLVAGLVIKRKLTKPAGIAILVLCFGFAAAGSIVSAGSYTRSNFNEATHTMNGPTIVVQQPYEGQIFSKSKAFDIQVRVVASECNNAAADLTVNVSFAGVTKTKSVFRPDSGCHDNGTCGLVDLALHHTFKGFTTPATDQSKDITVGALTNWYHDPVFQGSSQRKVTIVTGTYDFCPNIIGTQSSIPDNFRYDAVNDRCVPICVPGQHNDPITGLCVNDSTDLCPNLTGNQTTVPLGQHIDAAGQCVDDVCPSGQHFDANHICVYDDCPNGQYRNPVTLLCDPNPFDRCPNIADTQIVVPAGFYIDTAGNCVAGICPPGQVCDGGGNCPLGQHRNPAGMCVNDGCPANTHWDVTQNKCVADPLCPQFQHYDPVHMVCVPDQQCTDGALCTSVGLNKCGLHDGITICTVSGPQCVPLDPAGACPICDPATHKLCRGVCILNNATCGPVVTCAVPGSTTILNEGESIIMYDITRGLSAANNCSNHQERRFCQVDPTNPAKGRLSGFPNSIDDPHIYDRCTPFFTEV